jgi:hypothetical protein
MPSFHEFWVVYLAVMVAIAKWFFGSYLGKKGENLATREDVKELTRLVEDVKSAFAAKFETLAQANRALLQQNEQRHDLSMAALDKRLQVHQEAFARGFDLYFKTFDEQSAEVADRHLQWWRENCLYLSEDAAEAFMRACVAMGMHRGLVGKIPQEQLEENWKSIDRVWEKIAQDVKLPKIGEMARGARLVEAGNRIVHDALFWLQDKSAWGRWYTAQALANNNEVLTEQRILHTAMSNIEEKARKGVITILGVAPGKLGYEPLSPELLQTRACLYLEEDPRTLWRVRLGPYSDAKAEIIAALPVYDWLAIDLEHVKRLWPETDQATDQATARLLEDHANKFLNEPER